MDNNGQYQDICTKWLRFQDNFKFQDNFRTTMQFQEFQDCWGPCDPGGGGRGLIPHPTKILGQKYLCPLKVLALFWALLCPECICSSTLDYQMLLAGTRGLAVPSKRSTTQLSASIFDPSGLRDLCEWMYVSYLQIKFCTPTQNKFWSTPLDQGLC